LDAGFDLCFQSFFFYLKRGSAI
jgi:hypothetical protein